MRRNPESNRKRKNCKKVKMLMLDLTVVILTKNEESDLKRCIDSFGGIVKRFVVIDSGSTDNTVELAKSLGADVYYHEWTDHATQFNWGLKNVNIETAWTMRIDADEYLTPELCEEMARKIPDLDDSVAGIELNRRQMFLGRWMKHGGIYPIFFLRIFRTGKAYCEQTNMDEHLMLTEGRTIQFRNDFVNGEPKSLSWWIDKHNGYSDREVLDYLSKKKQLEDNATIRPDLFGNPAERKRWLKYNLYYKFPGSVRARLYFIYRYYIRLGFLDGKEGRMFTFFHAYWYRYLVDAKLYEYEKNGKRMAEQGELRQ